VDDHRITHREPLDPLPNLMDPAGRLVAHHERWRQAQVGEHAVEDMEICPAKPGAPDADDDIQWPRYCWFRDFVDDRLFAECVQSDRLHD
jgi:hypothetical protein